MGYHSESFQPSYIKNIGSVQSTLGPQKIEIVSLGKDYRIYINDANIQFKGGDAFNHTGTNFIQFQIEANTIKITGLYVDGPFRGNGVADIIFYSLQRIGEQMGIKKYISEDVCKPGLSKKLLEWGFIPEQQDTFCSIIGFEQNQDGNSTPIIDIYTSRKGRGFRNSSRGGRYSFYKVRDTFLDIPSDTSHLVPLHTTMVLNDSIVEQSRIPGMLEGIIGNYKLRVNRALDFIETTKR